MASEMRNTVYHEAIIKLLKEMKAKKLHLSGEEIYLILKRQFPTLNFSTIYRKLEKMSELGLVQKLKIPGHHTRYDANVEPHPHIRCIVCGSIEDWPGKIEMKITPEDATKVGYNYQFAVADIVGVCPQCLKNFSISE